MTRWKASAIHLGLSALIIGAIFLAVVSLWYPPALLPMSGVLGLVALIAIVDVCLGPLLTLIVYKSGKPSLKFDLFVIVALQLGMLGYGLYVLAQNRPVFMVGSIDRLELVRAHEIDASDLAEAPPQFRRLSWTGPVWTGVRLPEDPSERSQLLFDALAGRDLYVQPRYYLDFEAVRAELLAREQPMRALLTRLSARELRRLESAAGGRALDSLRYLAISSSRGAALVLIDQNGMLSDPIAIDPFLVQLRSENQPDEVERAK